MDSETHVKKIRCNTNRKAKATVQQCIFSKCQVLEVVVDGCYLIRMCPERIYETSEWKQLLILPPKCK